jgi:hypothetical protein
MQRRNLIIRKPVSDKKSNLIVEDLSLDQDAKKYIMILSIKDNDVKAIPTHVATVCLSVSIDGSYPMERVFVSSQDELKAARDKISNCTKVNFSFVSLTGISGKEEPEYESQVVGIVQRPMRRLSVDQAQGPMPKPNNDNTKWWIGAGAFFAVGVAYAASTIISNIGLNRRS